MENVSESNLTGKDIMPVKFEERTMTSWGFFVLWIGIAVQLVAFIVGAQMYPSLSPGMILLAAFIGNGITAVICVLTGDIGIRYGIPYTVYIRACFGYLGTHVPGVIRACPAIFWFGFQTWIGAYAINEIIRVSTGFNHLMLWTIVFGAVQILGTALGWKAILKLEWIAAPVIVIVGFILEYEILRTYHLSVGKLLTLPGKGGGGMTFSMAVMAQMGTYITLALNIPDFTRNMRAPARGGWWKMNRGSAWAQPTGLILSMVVFVFIGMTSGVATGDWNPIDILVKVFQHNTFLMILGLLFVLMAQWAANSPANLLPPALIISNFSPRKISFTLGCIVAGVVGLVAMPWSFANYVSQILIVISALLGPVAGIMITDYYLLRKRKINVNELYRPGGQYSYWKNINPAGVIAYVPGIISGFLSSTYGFVLALVVSSVLYYILMKFWVARVYPQPEILTSKKLKPNDLYVDTEV